MKFRHEISSADRKHRDKDGSDRAMGVGGFPAGERCRAFWNGRRSEDVQGEACDGAGGDERLSLSKSKTNRKTAR